jgi:hypothetical protein
MEHEESMTTNNITDPEVFNGIVEHSTIMKQNLSNRNSAFDEYEKMFLLEDDDVPAGAHVKKTLSPDARNALSGAVRLLTAADPIWAIPRELNTPETHKVSTSIEKVASAIWWASSRIAKKPLHFDPVLSALLYGEIHMRVTQTKDLVEKATSPAAKTRAQRAQQMTPVLIETMNPRNGFPEFDSLGLSAFYSEYMMRVSAVRSIWGTEADAQLGTKKGHETVTYCEYWNDTYHYVWLLESAATPILAVEHGLDEIPIVAQLCEGSEMFVGDQQETRQPFLYTLRKSNMWKRQNLELTAIYTNVNAIVNNPTFVYRRNDDTKSISGQMDFSIPGGVVYIGQNEAIEPLKKEAIDPAILKALEIAEQKGVESTIYKQTLGEPLGANAPFSMVSLLSQSGRLPLIPYQRAASFAFSDIMKIAMRMMKGSKQDINVVGNEGIIKFYSKDIPETFELTCNLDISMPTDERQNVVMATQATFGASPLVSQKWARENWLKITNPDEMQTEIWAEQLAAAQIQAQIFAQQQQMMPQPGQSLPNEAQSQLGGAENTSTPGIGVPGVPMNNPIEINRPLPGSGQPPQGGQTPGQVGLG